MWETSFETKGGQSKGHIKIMFHNTRLNGIYERSFRKHFIQFQAYQKPIVFFASMTNHKNRKKIVEKNRHPHR